jgi:pimeloyl-ACP methyl ester carboxylesterase
LLLLSCVRPEETTLSQPQASVPLGLPDDFPVLVDAGGDDTGDPITGFGGSRDERTTRRPVILIHGNGTPAQDIWPHYEHWLRERGYGRGDIWALNFLGEEGGAEATGAFRNNMEDVRSFIDAVIAYLDVETVDIVAVSLGCHLARGYVLGARVNDEGRTVFDPGLQRPDRVGTVVLISGANYGLGPVPGDADWDSDGPLFDPEVLNSFRAVDGREDPTPFDDRITWVTVSAEFDYPQTIYARTTGGTAGIARTTSLDGAENFIVGPEEGLGYPDTAGTDSNFANHRKLVRDPFVFSHYVLPALTPQ